MLYFPNQNYPERGYGGGLEPIGDFAQRLRDAHELKEEGHS